MIQFETILEKYSFPKRDQPSSMGIKVIEDKLSVKLSEDYGLYLERYHGFETFVGDEYVVLWGLEELLESNEDYEIQKYYPAAVGIGSNGGGEWIHLLKSANPLPTF